jgi:hypothetical protein
MAGKPLSIAAVLQEGLPKKTQPSGIPLKNRFNVFKDRSVSASSSRAESQKRPRRESPEAVDRNLAFKAMADEEEKFKKAKILIETCQKGVSGLVEKGMEGPLISVLNAITEWMALTTGVQETTANVVVDSFNKVASPARKSRKDSPRKVPEVDKEEEEKKAKKKKFVQEVREAERSTLIFKTNMGPVPVMNPETMKRKFTEDLAAKAAAEEGRTDGRPSQEAATKLDDALEMVTKMDFFGKETKKAKKKGNSNEEENFYTIPVRLFFKDKTTRDAADMRMKKMCKMGGSVPYHRTLRAVINKTIEEAKVKFPENYIQVKVDAENMKLKISRCRGGIWYNNVDQVELPDSVLDLSRSGPRPEPNRDQEGEMETESGDSEQPQG